MGVPSAEALKLNNGGKIVGVILTVDRYHVPKTFNHSSLKEAAEDAIGQLNNDLSYPVKVVDEKTGELLWVDEGGPFGVSLQELRKIAKGE